MSKGFFMTMDAAIGLLVVILIISTAVTLTESSVQHDLKELSRQARDAYDYNYLGGLNSLPYINNCQNSEVKAVVNSFRYNFTTHSIQKVTTTACLKTSSRKQGDAYE